MTQPYLFSRILKGECLGCHGDSLAFSKSGDFQGSMTLEYCCQYVAQEPWELAARSFKLAGEIGLVKRQEGQ